MVSNPYISVIQFNEFATHKITVDGNFLQPPTRHPRSVKVSSGYIRQMTEENLLIPDKSLYLQDCVGQGEVYVHCTHYRYEVGLKMLYIQTFEWSRK